MLIDPLTDLAGLKGQWPDHRTWEFFCMAVVVAPFAEELLFRAGQRLPICTLCIGPALCLLVFGPGRASVVVAGCMALFSLGVASLQWWFSLQNPAALRVWSTASSPTTAGFFDATAACSRLPMRATAKGAAGPVRSC